MREVTIAVVQMKPVLGEPEENLVKMSEQISKIASSQKVDLFVFPELISSGSELGLSFTELAQSIPGPTGGCAVKGLAKRWSCSRHGHEGQVC